MKRFLVMNCSFTKIFFLILVLVSAQLILFSCAGSPDIQESEKIYVEGVVVEGGVNGFRLKGDNGKIIRFFTRDKVEYEPLDFHAYYGDRVGVTYHPEINRGKNWPKALRVVLLSSHPKRFSFQFAPVTGIIRVSGVMRNLVYIPDSDLTVAIYKKGGMAKSPRNWSPKKGNQVLIYGFDASERFFSKFYCTGIHRDGEELVSISDKTEIGVITEIFVHRSVKSVPDRFAFQLENGETLTMYGGGETRLDPEGLTIQTGNSYSIEYYRLLMGDQYIRHVATKITQR